jgi:ABC-type lipoprotein release transport system permease subunit
LSELIHSLSGGQLTRQEIRARLASLLRILTCVSVSCALIAVALVATFLPARRASRVDRTVVLRADA